MEQINEINIHKKEVKTEGDDVIAYYFDKDGEVIAREYIDSVSSLREEFEAYAKDGTFNQEETWR